MLQTKDILAHIDALVRLSYDVKDRAVSEKLRQMADELRIMVSVADIANLAAGLSPKTELAKLPDSNGSLAIAKSRPVQSRARWPSKPHGTCRQDMRG